MTKDFRDKAPPGETTMPTTTIYPSAHGTVVLDADALFIGLLTYEEATTLLKAHGGSQWTALHHAARVLKKLLRAAAEAAGEGVPEVIAVDGPWRWAEPDDLDEDEDRADLASALDEASREVWNRWLGGAIDPLLPIALGVAEDPVDILHGMPSHPFEAIAAALEEGGWRRDPTLTKAHGGDPEGREGVFVRKDRGFLLFHGAGRWAAQSLDSEELGAREVG